jgi:hypothetical protein
VKGQKAKSENIHPPQAETITFPFSLKKKMSVNRFSSTFSNRHYRGSPLEACPDKGLFEVLEDGKTNKRFQVVPCRNVLRVLKKKNVF